MTKEHVIQTTYHDMVERLAKPGIEILAYKTPEMTDADHMAMGVASEAGELLDAIKRWTIYGKPLDRANVVEELGDIEFYMEHLRNLLGISRDETLIANMEKLNVRYADGYSDKAAIERADKEPGA